MINELKRKAQQVRDEYQAARVRRLAETSQEQTLAPPELPTGAIVDPADGTLNKDVLAADLPVAVQAWENLPEFPGDTSKVFVLWAKVAATDPPLDAEYKEVDQKAVNSDQVFPVQLKIPVSELAADGKHYLKILVEHWTGTGTIESAPMPLICDSEPPYVHDEPVKMNVPAVAVTDAYLAANGDKVIASIPEYSDYQIGDRVAYYWGKLPLPDDPVGIAPVGTIEVDNTAWPMPVEYPGDYIRATGDGGCYALYVLIDKATNISRISVYAPVGVALGALPDGLGLPEVPLAADGLLDLKDAGTGVVVQIPQFLNHKPTDTLVVTWGTTALDPDPVGSAPKFPLEIRVPPEVLQSTYANGTGAVDTPVSYRVMRGTLPSDAKSTTIKVDFSVIGPEPEPWPGPVNGKLALAEIYGEVSDTLNELKRADEGKDAILKFKLYNPLKADEIVSFYWNNVEVPEAQYTVKASDSPGAEVSVKVPWDYIKNAFNNPALPVHYRISAPDSPNEQHSPSTLVKANAVTPQLAAPTFQGLHNNSILNCNSLYLDPATPHALEPAIRVQVPDLSQPPFSLREGDTVTMRWIALSGRTDDTPIDSTKLEVPITLDAESVKGFVWRVQPYATHILPTYDPEGTGDSGRGRATYAFTLAGETVVSGEAEAVVAMHTGLGPCPIPPV